MTRAIKVGLFMPIEEYGHNGGTARWTDLAAYVRRAEELGYDSVCLADHMIFGRPGDSPPTYRGAWEAFSLISALAAITTRIEIGTLVACTQFRNPALLAKIADTIDEISGGRLILGIGAGWNAAEFQAFGYPFDHRIDRFEEALQIVHSLLKTGHSTFAGTYYQTDDCELRPRGPRGEGPPIMIGSVGPRMLDLTARYADRWNAEWWNVYEKGAPEFLGRVDTACEAAGRDPATLHKSLFVPFDMGSGTHGEGMGPISGDVPRLVEFLHEAAAMGFDEAQVWLDDQSLVGLEAFAPALAQL